MAVVYSTRFIGGLVTAATPLGYTVPGGYVAVVRDVEFAIDGAIACVPYFTLAGSFDIFRGGISVTDVWNQWRGRAVFNAGETFYLASSANVYGSASGYLLSLL
jgi:hypothetical protein